jgi:hypothetical protein
MLPSNLQRRFWSLAQYVRIVIEENEDSLPNYEKTRKDALDEITTVVFVVILSRFLHDGTEAAKRAVDAFKEVGLDSFFIGSAEFSGRNENVMLGEVLAKKLDDILLHAGIESHLITQYNIPSMALELRDHLKHD